MNGQAAKGLIVVAAAVLIGALILGYAYDNEVDLGAVGATPTEEPTADPNVTPTEAVTLEPGVTPTDAATDGEATDGDATDGDAEPTATTDPGTRAPSEVAVLVANAGRVGGAAGTIQGRLATEGGWNAFAATDATEGTAGEVSVIYFAEGYQPEALLMASQLGISETVVQPMPAVPPVADLQGANVLVVVGLDLSPTQ